MSDDNRTTSAPIAPIADLIERSLDIKHVFGQPIERNGITVVPVATVAYGFGAGGGRGTTKRRKQNGEEGKPGEDTGEGSGGGGGMKMMPAGALEISPAGTRFVRYGQLGQLVAAAALGAAASLLLRRRR